MTKRIEAARAVTAVDTAAKLGPHAIESVAAAGYSCIIRYVPHVGSPGAFDIDAAELTAILGAGLAVMLVQHPRLPGWNPATVSGVADADLALDRARTAGYLPGAHLFVDLEGISGTVAATTQYANDWSARVVEAGYLAGAYIGFAVPLSPRQLYALPNVNSYWSDLGPRLVDTRGFAMKQHATITLNGLQYDPDTIQPDQRGETPIWVTSAPVSDVSIANA